MNKAKNILVLDDQLDIAQLLSDTLKDVGHDAICFTCPDDAKKFFQENYQNIQLIITDYHLTLNTTGLDFIRFCHELSEVPYILISGEMSLVKDNYNKNEVAKLSKPFCSDIVIKLISD